MLKNEVATLTTILKNEDIQKYVEIIFMKFDDVVRRFSFGLNEDAKKRRLYKLG